MINLFAIVGCVGLVNFYMKQCDLGGILIISKIHIGDGEVLKKTQCNESTNSLT